MKHSFAINSLLAAVLVVPAVTLEAQQPNSLEDTLLRTVRALESLAGIQEVVKARTPPKPSRPCLQWTEPRARRRARSPGAACWSSCARRSTDCSVSST